MNFKTLPFQNQWITYMITQYQVLSFYFHVNLEYSSQGKIFSISQYIKPRNHTFPKVRTCARLVPKYLYGQSMVKWPHLHCKFGKTCEHTQPPNIMPSNPPSTYLNQSVSKICNLMNTWTSFKLMNFGQRELMHKNNMNFLCKTLMKMVIVPLIRRLIFSILNLSMNNECLYKILHHSYHAQDFFKSKVLNKIQLTTSPYKLINYKSWKFMRISSTYFFYNRL